MSTGVRGKVLKLTGDFMPMCRDERYFKGRNSTDPYKNTFVIVLFAPVSEDKLGSHSSSLERIKSHPKFIQMTQTNTDGEYQFDLPSGLEVTVVAWIRDKPYLNSYSTNGWSAVTVPVFGYVNFDIKDSEDAYY